jgi:hypothetical protein
MRVVEGFIEKLKTLPKKEKALGKNEALQAMRGHLRKARDDGYTLDELVKEMGIGVSIDTLRAALRESRKRELVGKKSSSKRESNGGMNAPNADKSKAPSETSVVTDTGLTGAEPRLLRGTDTGSTATQSRPLRRSGFVVRPDRQDL